MREFVVNQENFHKEIEKQKNPVLLIFWGHGDALSMRQRLIASRLATEQDMFDIGSVCCNEEPYLANRFQISRGKLPAVILMQRGSARCGKYHFMTKEEILKMVSKYFKQGV